MNAVGTLVKLGFALVLLLSFSAGAQTSGARCDLAGRPFTLPLLETAIANRELSLLVVAPAAQSPAGADTSRDDGSLPFRIVAALRAQRPDLAIDLDTIDNTGLGLSDVMPILAERLSQRPVALVVWQVGNVEIARGDSAALVSSILADAAGLVSANNADLILVDPDPDPTLENQPDFLSIEASLAQAAAHNGVAFYRQTGFGAAATPACTSHGIAHLITHS